MSTVGSVVCLISIGCLTLVGWESAAEAACLPAPSSLVESGALTVGTSLTAPPLGFMKDGQPTGFDTDLVTALADKMCLKPKFVDLTFQGLFPGLVARKFDIVAARVGITDDRKKAFDFVPVFKGGLRLVARKGSGLWFTTEREVCGHPVSVVAGATQMAALEQVKGECPADRPMEMKTFADQIQALNDVAKQAVDAAYVDWPIAAYVIQQRPNVFAEASPVLSGRGPDTARNRNGIVVRKSETSTEDAVAGTFAAVLADGTYDRILAKWNLIDGDIRKQGD